MKLDVTSYPIHIGPDRVVRHVSGVSLVLIGEIRVGNKPTPSGNCLVGDYSSNKYEEVAQQIKLEQSAWRSAVSFTPC